MKSVFTLALPNTRTLARLTCLLVFSTILSHSAMSQTCTIDQSGCPTDINVCASIPGAPGQPDSGYAKWTAPGFILNCGTGGQEYNFQMLWDLPENKLATNCWDFNFVQRTGDKTLGIWKSNGTAPPFFITPALYFTGPTNFKLVLFGEINYTVKVYLIPVSDPNIETLVWTINVPGNSTPTEYTTIIDPGMEGSYRVKYVFETTENYNGKTNYVDFVGINAILASASCGGGIEFVVTGPQITEGNFPVGSTPITYKATYTPASGSVVESTCTFNINVNGITPSYSNVVNTTCGLSNGSFVLNAVASGNPTSLEYSLNGGAWTTFTTGATISGVASGNNSVNVRANYAGGLTCTALSALTVPVGQSQDIILPVITTCPQNASFNSDANQCYSSRTFSATATDNCDANPVIKFYIGQTEITFPYNFPVGITTVSVVATDASGNNSEPCTFTVTITDTQKPVVTCPQPASYDTDADKCPSSRSFTATAIDNCGAVSNIKYYVGGTAPGNEISFPYNFPKGVTTVTVIATDVNNNASDPCSFTVTVSDKQKPVVNCPTNVSVNNDADKCYSTQSISASATDNCDISPAIKYFIGETEISFPYNFPVGLTTVSVVATDGSGNASNPCTFTVTVTDNQKPLVTCPQNASFNTDANQCYSSRSFTATATDNCGTVTNIKYYVGGTDAEDEIAFPYNFPTGVTTVSVIARDVNGNASEPCSFTVTITDNQKPVVTCPQNATFDTDANQCYSRRSFTATATDNCDNSASIKYYIGQTEISFPYNFPTGITTVTVKATDVQGNISDPCNFTVTVSDKQKPVVVCPSNISVNNDVGQCYSSQAFMATATDNCDNAPVIKYYINQTEITSPYNFPAGVNTVSVVATDASGNASDACTFTVTVADNQKPVITACASPQTGNIGAQNCTVPVPNFTTGVTASDNCTLAGSLTITQLPVAGTLLGVGQHTITITVADQAGNSATCTTTFTVSDNINPVIVTCPAPQSANANNNCVAPVPNFVTGVVATDNCTSSGNLQVTQSPAAGTLVGRGITIVTITVRDANNNLVTCTTTFTVADNTPPSFVCPIDITTADDGCGTVMIAIAAPTTTDNCGTASVTGVRSDGKPLADPYAGGTTTILWTATDEAGLTSTCTQTIVVTKSEGTILVNYSFVGMTAYPFNANETAPGITSNVTSSEPFVPQSNGTSTGPLAFKPNIGTNEMLVMQPSDGENTRYFQFQVSGDKLKFYSQFKIYFQGSRQPQAANKINVAYSTDGVNYTFSGSLDIPLQREWYEALIDYSAIAALNGNNLGNLYIRLYASGGTSGSSSDATRLEVDNFQVFAKGLGVFISCRPDIVVNVASPADCSAVVELITPTGESRCGAVTVMGSRSDGKTVSDPFPAGTTIITWTATDAGGNTAFCTQSVTVNGAAGGIKAENDLYAVNQGEASMAGNVLENDLLDCKQATTSNVTIAEVSGASDPGVKLNIGTGAVTVEASTPVGSYTIVYRICETGVTPDRCDEGTITVNVDRPLPVSGLRLFGNRAGNDVNLNWVTVAEQNSSHFILERSLDGLNFAPIPAGNRVAAAGSSNNQRNYNQVDRNMVATVMYYRVRLYDNDGSFRMSNVVAVRMAQGREFRVYPNPVVNMVTIEFAENGKYRVDLLSASGQLIQVNREVLVTNSMNTITVPRNNIPAGMYELRVTNTSTGKVSTVKLIYQPR